MITKIKSRLASEQGFTLIELLVVIIILGILTAIAVPAYMSFRGSAQDAAAKSNVRSAEPAAEEFFQALTTDTPAGGSGSYTGITGAALRLMAPGVSPNVKAGPNAGGTSYCIQDTEGTSSTFYYEGGTSGTATLTSGSCPAAYTVA